VDAEELIRQTSESVRAALEAAQQRADEIVREAEVEAQHIRSRAEAQARERLDDVRHALEQLEAGLGAKSAPRRSNTEPKPQASEPEPVTSAPETEPQPAAAAPNETPSDDAGAARLVAMKLALDGTSRDEAREQLAADYRVADLDSLLDEVYSKAGK
jgi:TolA-binding protein